MASRCSGRFGDEFDPEDVEALLGRLEAAYRKKRSADPSGDDRAAWREAIEETGREAVKENLIEARQRRYAVLAAERREARLGELTGAGLRDDRALAAFNVGSERGIAGTGNSVDARGLALEVQWQGGAYGELMRAGVLDRLQKWHGGRDREFELSVVNEMGRLNGRADLEPSPDPQVQAAARILNKYVGQAREAQNAQGAWIEQLQGYVLRQSHDPLKITGGFFRGMNRAVRDQARDRWINDILPRLSDETFANVGAEQARRRNEIAALAGMKPEARARRIAEIDPEGFAGLNESDLRRAWLKGIWNDIATGRHDVWDGVNQDLDAFRPPSGRARQVSASRTLHFKDPTAWYEYNEQYGRGSILNAFDSQIRRGARNTALMEAWGPNPRAAFEAHTRARIDAARDRGDVETVQGLERWLRKAEFDQLDGTGDAPESVRLASITRAILQVQQLSKLGGMFLSSFTDTSLAANALARSGVSYLDSYAGLYQSVAHMQGPHAREIADNLGVAARVMAGDVTSRFGAMDGANGVMGRMSGVFYKANMFTWWAGRIRRGAGVLISRHLGRYADTPMSAMDGVTASQLKRYGINEGLWDVVRAGAREFGDEGRFLTMDAADGIDARAAARALGMREGEGGFTASQLREAEFETRWRLQSYFADLAENSMTEPRARERAAIRGGQRAGTPVDMALRLFMQFKTFPTTVMTRQLSPALQGANGVSPVAATAHLIIASTALGFVAMQAKMLARGLTPRPLTDEEGNPRLDVVLASMMQGGGMGIYGDLIMADANRMGQGLADTLGGPAIGELTYAASVAAALRDAVIHGEDADAGAMAFNMIRRNTPFANLFYTKAALDYALIYGMQERASPGFLRRYEQRLEREQGVRFYVPPSEVVE